MLDTNTILISFIAPLLIAVFATLITAYFSLRRFRKERMWELKVDTYEGIFDALYDFDEFLRNRIHEEVTGDELDEEEEELLISDYNDASYDLGRVVLTGEFVIDTKAINLLNELNIQLQSKEPSWWRDLFTSKTKYDHFKKQREYISGAVEELRNIAKKELKVHG